MGQPPDCIGHRMARSFESSDDCKDDQCGSSLARGSERELRKPLRTPHSVMIAPSSDRAGWRAERRGRFPTTRPTPNIRRGNSFDQTAERDVSYRRVSTSLGGASPSP